MLTGMQWSTLTDALQRWLWGGQDEIDDHVAELAGIVSGPGMESKRMDVSKLSDGELAGVLMKYVRDLAAEKGIDNVEVITYRDGEERPITEMARQEMLSALRFVLEELVKLTLEKRRGKCRCGGDAT